jgi:diacylglycerol kinase family enzyme
MNKSFLVLFFKKEHFLLLLPGTILHEQGLSPIFIQHQDKPRTMQSIQDGPVVPPASGPQRTAALVLNEAAGAVLSGKGGGDTLQLQLDQRGLATTIIPPGGLADRIANARDSGAEIIVIAGGDGTVACAAQVLSGSRGTLGIIPLGTMNLLAKDLQIPVGDVAGAIDILAAGTAREIDVAEISGADGDRQIFLCAAMLGSPARLGRHREDGRRRGNGLAGWWHFARALARARSRHKPLPFTLKLDGVVHRLRTSSLTVTVNALDGEAGTVFGRSRLDGGELFVYVVRHRSMVELARVLFHALAGRFGSDPAVTVLHGRQIELDSPDAALRVLVDGEEHLLKVPLRARILGDRLRVMAPAA